MAQLKVLGGWRVGEGVSSRPPLETHVVDGEGFPLPLSGAQETGLGPGSHLVHNGCLYREGWKHSHKPTTHTEGGPTIPGRRGRSPRKPHPQASGTQGLPRLTLGQDQRPFPAPWLQPGQHRCLSSVVLHQGKADACRGPFCVPGM